MRKALFLTFSHLKHDARVRRQIEFIREQFQPTVVAFDRLDDPSVESIVIPVVRPGILSKLLAVLALLTRKYEWAYQLIYGQKTISARLSDRKFDLVVANDIETLPLAAKLKGEAKLIFDAHEYAPRHFEDKLIWRVLFKGFNNYLCRRYIPSADRMLTVSVGLAQEYRKNFDIEPVVLTNASSYHDLAPRKINPDQIKMVHHGAANPSRKIELMIELAKQLDARFTLDLILLSPSSANKKTKAYLDWLVGQIDGDRIRILPPVESSKVVATINKYDIGLFLLPPTNFNYQNALPNKLFDFIQARLAVAIGPTPEMAQIVKNHDLGIVSSDFRPGTLATMINALSAEDITRFKENADKASFNLSASTNKTILKKVVSDIF